MNSTLSPAPPFYRSPAFVGSVWGLLSALAYAVTNIMLRELSEDTNSALVTCMKAVPTFVISCALIGHDYVRGRFAAPTAGLITRLIITALVVQFLGNWALQAAFGLIGLALTVPLSFGTLIVLSALLGRIWLAEPITPRMVVSMALLVLSIALLTAGAEETQTALPQHSAADRGGWLVALGVLLACISGLGYALVAVVIRSVAQQASVATILFVISATGIATLAPTAAAQIGPVGLGQVTTGSWGYMLLAGSFNAVGFFALGKSLKLISVVHANVINASQVAIAAVSGIVLFGEPGSWPLLLGVAIAIVGLVVVREPTPATAAET